MEIDDSKDKAFCPYCGQEIVNFHQKIDINQKVDVTGTVVTKADRTNEPNLEIEFSSSDPKAVMVIAFSNNRMRRVINNGQSASMHLPLGHTVAVMNLAGKKYKRNIWIVEEAPVRINASAFGRRDIVIDQPPYQNASGGKTSGGSTGEKPSKLSVAAFVLALTVIGAPIGLVLGIISLIKKDKSKKLGLAGTIIGGVITVAAIIGIIAGASGKSSTPSYGMGQAAKVGSLEYTVNSARNTKHLGGEYIGSDTANNYVVLNMTVKNVGSSETRLYDEMMVYHSGSHEYKPSSDGAYLDDGYWLTVTINPGLVQRFEVVFEIPQSYSTSDYLEVKASSYSYDTAKIYMGILGA